jgi:hypothetical protein
MYYKCQQTRSFLIYALVAIMVGALAYGIHKKYKKNNPKK